MNRALIVIDVQNSFLYDPLWPATSAPDIVERTQRLVEISRDRDDLIVWVMHAEPGEGGDFDPASGHVQLMDGLVPETGEPIVYKSSHNAFTTTNLAQVLMSHGIREVVIAGIRTEQCCETTARLASDLGYVVVFVTEATATTPREHRDAPEGRALAEILADPRTLPAADILERTEYALADRFAIIATIDELAGALTTAG